MAPIVERSGIEQFNADNERPPTLLKGSLKKCRKKHPIIAVTGSSGSGTTTTGQAVRHIFRYLKAEAAFIEGDSFHRYSRPEMDVAIRKHKSKVGILVIFGPEANNFEALEQLFQDNSETGQGKHRRYLHNFDEAVPYNQMPGTFTPWEALPENTDILFYEGLMVA